jgi:ABC-2 type transport system permease protein
MRALLLKDFDVMTHGLRSYLILLAIFAMVPYAGCSGFAMVYAAMLPYQAFAYDERSKWDTYAAMMPYSTRMLVTSKYAFAWCGIAAVGALGAISRFVQLLAGRAEAKEELLSLLPLTGISLLILALTLPLVCRFGVEKGRLLFIAVIAVTALGFVSGAQYLSNQNTNEPAVILLLIGVSIAGVVAQPISIWLSQKLYRRRFYYGVGSI